jgi:hypothetical protein
MAASLDKQAFCNTGLFEIKIPLNLPYFNNSQAFERYDGSIEVRGLHYNYVERKVLNDTLILHCLPNAAQNKLVAEQNEYAKTSGNIQYPAGSRTNAASLLLAMLITGSSNQNISFQLAGIDARIVWHRPCNDDAISSVFHLSPEQPPETI